MTCLIINETCLMISVSDKVVARLELRVESLSVPFDTFWCSSELEIRADGVDGFVN